MNDFERRHLAMMAALSATAARSAKCAMRERTWMRWHLIYNCFWFCFSIWRRDFGFALTFLVLGTVFCGLCRYAERRYWRQREELLNTRTALENAFAAAKPYLDKLDE
jgi:hypothetical protein